LNVQLVSAGDRKIQVIKVVREMTGWGLKEAKGWVDSAPSAAIDVPSEQAEAVAAALRAAGATAEVENAGSSRPSVPPDHGEGHPPSLVDELERLTALQDQGALSPAEFAAAKARLLGLA
jgi:hypothetical protein